MSTKMVAVREHKRRPPLTFPWAPRTVSVCAHRRNPPKHR